MMIKWLKWTLKRRNVSSQRLEYLLIELAGFGALYLWKGGALCDSVRGLN